MAGCGRSWGTGRRLLTGCANAAAAIRVCPHRQEAHPLKRRQRLPQPAAGTTRRSAPEGRSTVRIASMAVSKRCPPAVPGDFAPVVRPLGAAPLKIRAQRRPCALRINLERSAYVAVLVKLPSSSLDRTRPPREARARQCRTKTMRSRRSIWTRFSCRRCSRVSVRAFDASRQRCVPPSNPDHRVRRQRRRSMPGKRAGGALRSSEIEGVSSPA